MDDTPPSILGSLPKSRPQHRSSKRGGTAGEPPQAAAPPKAKAAPNASSRARAATASATKPKAGAKAGKPAPKRRPARQPGVTTRVESPAPGAPKLVSPTPSVDLTKVIGTGIKAAAELAEIGLSATTRALKLAITRLPRP